MKPFLIDVPVLILFFNRPNLLKAVFDQVRIARPSKLFLYQDGPRNSQDMIMIKACREVVANIDWECEVYRFYQEKIMDVIPQNIFPKNGLFLMLINVLF